MDDTFVTESDKTEHLGLIISTKEGNILNIQKRMSLARRTLYSLTIPGLRGCNDLNQNMSFKIYQVYVIPRLLYGLEMFLLTLKQLDQPDKFHLEIWKKHTIFTRTANALYIAYWEHYY